MFSVGGGCDADVPVIAYLNKKYGGKLTVLWLDAHGDLNSPQESQTGLFYGMPARTLLFLI
ncbi:arginase family protein [Phascolarctobacterium sp.]|uniref:arginase family protein n=1 Tax=Phascolarctobacterium sp. TaxID=2049039 RepID=UPI0034C5EC3B